jgi:hypothetical protein
MDRKWPLTVAGAAAALGNLPAPHSRFTFLEGTDDNCQKAQCGLKFKPHFTGNRRVSCFEFGSPPSKSIIYPWNSSADRSRRPRPWPSLYERQRRIIPFLTDIVMSGIKGRAAETNFPISVQARASMNNDRSIAPHFDEVFRTRLLDLFCWRRDVRRFRTEPLPPGMLERFIEIACLAPSVGLSQPWRFVIVSDPGRRQAATDNFELCNADALSDYTGDLSTRYAALKLAGLREAPCHLAVFADRATVNGHGHGRRTMPERCNINN